MAEDKNSETNDNIADIPSENSTIQEIDNPSSATDEAQAQPEITAEVVAEISEDTDSNIADDTNGEGEFTLPQSTVWIEGEITPNDVDEEITFFPTSEDARSIQENAGEVIANEQSEIPVTLREVSENPSINDTYFPVPTVFSDSETEKNKTPDEEQILIDIASVVGEETEGEDSTDETVKEDFGESSQDKESNTQAEEPPSRFVDSVFDFVELAIFTLAFIMILTSFFFRHSIVEGDSMLGTLEDGQHLIISDFMYEPKFGDIVVVEDYTTALKKPIIKRVIATEGQKVRIAKEGIYVDGRYLRENYVYTSVEGYYYDVYPSVALLENETLTITPGLFYEFYVPEGELFVMGDHRNRSTDSRDIGTVRVDAVLGKVILRVYPFDSFGGVD